jgi:hypothetical protein
VSGDPAGVSLNATVGVTNPGGRGHNPHRVAKMTTVDVLGRVDELTDGTRADPWTPSWGGNRSISEIPAQAQCTLGD